MPRWSPKTLARLELARAVGGALAVPARYALHLVTRRAEMARIAEDVREADGAIDPAPAPDLPRDRPLRVFVSAAEASGEIHAATLVRELRRIAEGQGAPPPEITCIGSDRLRALGLDPIADPVGRAEMGFDGVLQSLPYYVGVLESAAAQARDVRPDVFVPIDSPALHVPMARVVRASGAPVVHLVTPQYWGWAPWRVRAYRRAVDLGLSILPHEPRWFRRHGVATKHVGHPLLDVLADVPQTTPDPASRTLALLPGSRAGVIRRNLPWMLETLGPLRAAHPDVDVAVLQSTDEHRALCEEAIAAAGGGARLSIGDLHGDLALARAAFAVSGTVLTDVLHHRLPAVVVYRLGRRRDEWLSRRILTCPYFASTNLLAGEEVLPEHTFAGEGPRDEVAGQVLRTFADEAYRAGLAADLDRAAARLGPPGAVGRAAAHALTVAIGRAGR